MPVEMFTFFLYIKECLKVLGLTKKPFLKKKSDVS